MAFAVVFFAGMLGSVAMPLRFFGFTPNRALPCMLALVQLLGAEILWLLVLLGRQFHLGLLTVPWAL